MTSPAEEYSSLSYSKGEPTPPGPSKLKQRGVKRKLPTDSDVGNEILAIEDGSTGKKPAMFQRIWSEKDEKEILKALAEFVADTGLEPYKEVYAFHDFLKKSKPLETSALQLKEKIRRMEKKFMNSTKGKSKTKLDFEILQLAQEGWACRFGGFGREGR
ncbi:Mediator-associated protein 1 [Spatholobus suberectus]|nr:Mediator-associated protein 1 [Spatholobus suberectus]